MSHGRLYQSKVKNTFDKRVLLHKFSEGDLVLKKVLQVQKDHRGK